MKHRSPKSRLGSPDAAQTLRNAIVSILAALTLGASGDFAMAMAGPAIAQYSALGTANGSAPAGAVDGNRFATNASAVWRGATGVSNTWWQVDFGRRRPVGAILQIVGDHDFVFQRAPRSYVWQASLEGQRWRDLPTTRKTDERRLYRIHRLPKQIAARFLRLRIDSITGDAPVLRELQFYERPDAAVPFPDWVVAVNVTDDRRLPGHGQEFIPLARKARAGLSAQQICLTDFTPEFCAAEPRPLATFLSGSFKDWCEVNREDWRGTQRILRAGETPMWASCGGAQGLAILAEAGVDQPWDCPHCRDPQRPKLPIYTHLGHFAARACGDYSGCVFERGPVVVRRLVEDPVFAGLPDEFEVMESHCGQIAWAPKGWEWIAAGQPGALTRIQAIRVKDRPIYAAQFHIEMAGTPATSELIMLNFLNEASRWRLAEAAREMRRDSSGPSVGRD